MSGVSVTKTNKRGARAAAPHSGTITSPNVSYVCKPCEREIAAFAAKRGLINPAEMFMSGRCDRCRFLKYVQVTPTCWLWTGTSYTHGGKRSYGQSWFQGRRMGAHRASYLMHKGPVPDGMEVMHECDTPACVNPDHLEAGTHRRNISDARDRNGEWSPYGENHGRARLTWAKVDAIRAAAAAGAKHVDLAKQYGCTAVNISHIVRGKRWVGRGVREAVA